MNAATARLGAPLAASLALHAVLLGAAIGDSETVAARLPATLVVQLDTPAAAPPPPRSDTARTPSVLPKRYLTSSEVDERAAPLEMAALLYPEKAYLNRIRGTVRMRIYISSAGRVDKVEVVEAAPKGHFEQAAMEAVQRTSFTPARKGGHAVPSQKLIEVEFDPYGPRP